MSDNESPVRPEEGVIAGTRSRRLNGRHRPESKLPLLVAAALAFLVGMFFCWVLRPTPGEELSAARAEIARLNETVAARDTQIAELQATLDRIPAIQRDIAEAQRQLENRWTIPKPSPEAIQAFFRRVSNGINCMLNCARTPKATGQAEQDRGSP